MAETPVYPMVGPNCVESVLVVRRFERPTGRIGQASSQPGHLLQLVTRGRVRMETGSRVYDLRPGSLIWYHENEWVHSHVLRGPWVFYSVGFIAPTLTPPPFEQRVRQAGAPTRRAFDYLYKVWHDLAVSPQTRQLRVHGAMSQVLASLPETGGQTFTMNEAARLWWRIEGDIRGDLSQPLDLPALVRLTGKSAATIARSCHVAVGLSPMKRIKQIRLSLARGLVQRSELRIGEIAARIGYVRVHEFSRDYRRQFGKSPAKDRV